MFGTLAAIGGLVITIISRGKEAKDRVDQYRAGDKTAFDRPPRRSPRSHGGDGPDY
ncbi:MAG: hypothetical protein PVI21_00620 [Candidatus Woesebacteria bacterium]|jgi:hypothetical protein